MNAPADQFVRPNKAYQDAIRQALLLVQNRDTAGARSKLKSAVAGSRIDAEGLIVLADIFRASGRKKAAYTVLRKVMRREPTNTGAFYNLQIYHLSDNEMNAAIETAIAYFDAGGTVDYSHKIVRQILAKIASARSQYFLKTASLPYTLARIYLLGARFQKARAYFMAAPERQLAEAEIAAVDIAMGGALPQTGRYNWAALPSKVLRQIVIERLVNEGRADEALSILDHPSYAPVRRHDRAKQPPADAHTHLFMSVMPKSGSSYLVDSFETLSGLPVLGVSYQFGEQNRVVIPSWIDLAIQQGAVPAGHCPATAHNIAQFERHGLPVFVHVRDPRDQVWSLYRWIEEMTVLEKSGSFPADYSERPEEERIWMVYEKFFPQTTHWIATWKAYIDQKRNPVFVSRYEDFTKNNAATIKNLLELCNITVSTETLEDIAASKRDAGHHFRQGLVGGWRRKVKSREALAIIDKYWDDDVMSHFGYTK